MAEDKTPDKPKLEGKKPNRWQNNKRRGGENRPKQEKYRAPTPGLEDRIFTVGTAKDAANFIDVKKDLARWVGVNFKIGSSMAQAAIDDLVEPNITKPRDLGATPTQMETKIWELDYEKYYKRLSAWEDAEPRAFQLILAHCHPILDEKLAASSTWDTIKAGHKLVALLTLVRSFVHKHDEVKQGTMGFVEHTLHWDFRPRIWPYLIITSSSSRTWR
jgi:hypothetical protein